MEKSPKSSVGQTISRAVAILRVISDNPGASFGQVAKATGLPRSTVQRLIGVLNQEGLVTKAFGQQGTYLGMELARLGANVRIDARALLRPYMEKLHSEIGDNIDLTTIENGAVFVIEQIASNEAIRVISYVGMRHPIHCTANGKAHLSMLDRDIARDLVGPAPEAFTQNTITDADKLLEQIDSAQASGLFTDSDEYDEGASAVAVALPRIGGKDFAISIAMPSQRLVRQREAVHQALLSMREEVFAEYGKSI